MRSEDPDRELARLFEEQRRADETAAPSLRELLARSHRETPRQRSAWKFAFGAATVAAAIASLLLLRPGRRQTDLAPATAQLASWKAPTDALLRTPGSELWTRVPILVSPHSPAVDPAHPVQTTKGVGE